MSRRPRRNHTPAFKAKMALAAVKGEMTLAQLTEHFDVHAQSSACPVSIPTGGARRRDSFLEGALTKAGLLSAKR